MRGSQPGFGLVETIVGLLLGTFALMAMAGVMVSSIQAQRNAVSRMELTSLAETKMDQLRSHAALPTSDTMKLSVGGSLTSNVADHWEAMTNAAGRAYAVRWRVETGVNGTRDVTVRVQPVTPALKEVPYADAQGLMLIR